MNWDNILNDLINDLRPESIPMEFVIAAKYVDRYGNEHLLKGPTELLRFINHPEQYGAREAQVVLDIARIRRVMHDKIMDFFLDLNGRIAS